MMSTLKAVKRADTGPMVLGPVVGMALRQTERPAERVLARPMGFRLASSGQSDNNLESGYSSPAPAVRATVSMSVPPTPASSEEHGEAGCAVHLTPAERKHVETKLRNLTVRERDVLFAICQGGTNEEIADRLCVALPTVRTHLMRLNQKLGTTSKGDVVRFVLSHLLAGYRQGALTASSGT